MRQQAVIGDVDAIITTGGTGLTSRDSTFEAIDALLTKRLPGFGELFRMLSYQDIGSAAMMSRACAGTIGRVVVISLPGSEKAVRLAMDKLVIPELAHLVQQATKKNAKLKAQNEKRPKPKPRPKPLVVTPTDFLATSGVVVAGTWVPDWTEAFQATGADGDAARAEVAEAALARATALGASYADIRISRYRRESIATRERQVQNVSRSTSYGLGLRVLVNGAWGFAATNTRGTRCGARRRGTGGGHRPRQCRARHAQGRPRQRGQGGDAPGPARSSAIRSRCRSTPRSDS